MSDITLSKAVRSNLLNLQSTASLLSKSQERLSSGLRVNSALDNPTNFFTAQGLNSRANDLSQLSDAVSNAVQTVAAADKGISAITKLVESAQATARQALQTAATVSETNVTAQATVTGDVNVGADVAATTSSDLGGAVAGTELLNDAEIGIADGDTLTITGAGIDPVSITFATAGTSTTGATLSIGSADVDDLVAEINAQAGATIAAVSGGEIVLTADDATNSLAVGGAAATTLGFDATADATNAVIGALSGTLTVGSNTLTFGAGNIETRADLATALAAFTGDVDGSITAGGFLQFDGTNDASFTVGGSLDVDAAFGIAEAAVNPTSTTADVANPKRAELVETYNDLLGQIDALAKDSGFNGVNLLNGDDLSVLFNEDGSSKLDIEGVTNTATALGLTTLGTTAFDTNTSINSTLDDLKAGIETLRSQSAKFGANLSVVETRQDFTKQMISVLQTGAANLTLADTNEEAANVLALQTRQQLSSTALSLASQADQNVLRLF
jgi:flagellin